MKLNMFCIAVNVIGIVVGFFAAIMAVKNNDYGKMLLMETTVTINIILATKCIFDAIRIIVHEELEKMKTKQES